MPLLTRLNIMITVTSAGMMLLPNITTAGSTLPATSIRDAISQGSVYGQLRPRYEYVDENNFNNDANALTLRTRLGYRTAEWNHFDALLEFEDVRSLGAEEFNSTTNTKTDYPVVPDPESTEINQAILAYSGFDDTRLQFGRQYISLDNERWIGPVGWRQNSVTMDAFTVTNNSMPDTIIYYGYISNVNRLFGKDHPTMSTWNMDSHILNITYSGLPSAHITGYGYFLDFKDTASQALSTRTLGTRLDGEYPVNDTFKFLYTIEYADQSDYANGRTRDADYYYLTLGMKTGRFSMKLNQERLSGNGTYSVTTPLSTVHAHNGWADKFLATALSANGVPDGIIDTNATVAGVLSGFKLMGVFHHYSSHHNNYTYGNEWDIMTLKPVNRNLKLIAKYADYSASHNQINAARNPVQNTDTRKFWIMADFTF